jgi:hypothetical protein
MAVKIEQNMPFLLMQPDTSKKKIKIFLELSRMEDAHEMIFANMKRSDRQEKLATTFDLRTKTYLSYAD